MPQEANDQSDTLSPTSIRRALKAWDSVEVLGTHPLANLRLVEMHRRTADYSATLIGRGLALREVLRDAIEALKLDDDAPDTKDRRWWPYFILLEQYVNSRKSVWVIDNLNVSRRTYYNEQERALQAVGEILRERGEQLPNRESESLSDSRQMPTSTPEVGYKLNDRYEIVALLGQGGMSTVYKAYDPNLQRTVAVKLIHKHLSSDPEFIRRFETEAAAVAQLRHQHIIQVHDFNREGSTYYMVLEFVPGKTLQERLKRLTENDQVLSLEEVIEIAGSICDAVDYAHRRGMVHRDIKPANIMLNVRGEAILMDFGIVKMAGEKHHTATGALVGTALYMSPEQIRGDKPDQRADIYSLGVMLFEMLSGKPPFDADSAMSIMMMHLHDPVPNIWALNPDIPIELKHIIEKSLAKEPEDRYQSAGELAQGLRDVLLASKTKVSSPPPESASAEQPQVAPAPPEREKKPKSMLVGGGILLLLIVVFGGWFLFSTLFSGSVQQPTGPAATDTRPAPAEATAPEATARVVASTVTPAPFPSSTITPTPGNTTPATSTPFVSTPTPVTILGGNRSSMALIPRGSFEMGGTLENALRACEAPGYAGECLSSNFEDEEPPHPVWVDDFYIDQYEVTNQQFATFLADAGNLSEGGVTWFDVDDAEHDMHIRLKNGIWTVDEGYETHPVVEVTWYGASAYCAWRGARLPTEAEWEKAAKGSADSIYPWGDMFAQGAGNFCDNSCEYDWANGEIDDGYARTAPVGSFPNGTNMFGIYDMAGNVMEWVADWYAPDYYASSAEENPAGPSFGPGRVMRGGSWYRYAFSLRTVDRESQAPENSHGDIGFRCAMIP